MKTSEPFIASSKEFTLRSVANSAFCELRLGLSLRITPLLSHIIIFSFFAPNFTYIRVHEMAAAPAPFTTIFTLEISFSAISRALIKAAPEIIAVPC